MRKTWDELPKRVRRAVEDHAGPVISTEAPSAGRNSDFSATLYAAAGPTFCKGIEGDTMHEEQISQHLPSVAPRLLWSVHAEGWVLLGFEQALGRHADLSPGSPDLPKIVEAVNTMRRELTHSGAPAPRLADQWSRLAAWRRINADYRDRLDDWTRGHLTDLIELEAAGIELAAGDSLVHTDLHSLNIVVDEHATVVDWAWSRLANPDVDTAFLTARLIAAGHIPADAQLWGSTSPELAATIYGIWTYQSIRQPRPLWDDLVPAARQLTQHLVG